MESSGSSEVVSWPRVTHKDGCEPLSVSQAGSPGTNTLQLQDWHRFVAGWQGGRVGPAHGGTAGCGGEQVFGGLVRVNCLFSWAYWPRRASCAAVRLQETSEKYEGSTDYGFTEQRLEASGLSGG